MNVKASKLFKDAGTKIQKHSPEIFTAMGIGLGATTVVLAVKGTPKALALIEQRREELEVEKLAPVEVVKATWKCYIPAAVTGLTSAAFIIGASSVNAKRNAALATAYTLTETALREYKDKVVETIGEKKEREVRDAVAKDRIDKDPVAGNQIIVTGNGDVHCYDTLCKRYFKSNVDELKRIQNELNERLFNENYISLNEFYYAVGLPGCEIGDEVGWRVDSGLIELDFSAQLDSDNDPCIVVDFMVTPKYNYDKLS